jgi:hypothetical protein
MRPNRRNPFRVAVHHLFLEHDTMKIYTAQKDSHNNWVVCRGTDQRRGYTIIFTGSYDDCWCYKLGLRP